MFALIALVFLSILLYFAYEGAVNFKPKVLSVTAQGAPKYVQASVNNANGQVASAQTAVSQCTDGQKRICTMGTGCAGENLCVNGMWADCAPIRICRPGRSTSCQIGDGCNFGITTCNSCGDGWSECVQN